MKYYKDSNNQVYAYESDGSQDQYIKQGLIGITDEDKNFLLAPTEQQLIIDKIAEYKAYLNSTDWRFARLAETGEPVPQDVLDKRAEARAFIRANEG